MQIADQTRELIESALPDLPDRPSRVYTVGRGSSDHAALVIQHLLGNAGIPSTSMPLSNINEVVDSANSLYLLISQSGSSPDICHAATLINRAGCPVVSLVNHENSRLATEASFSLSQHAGNEIAVAATKSVICSIVAGALLSESWGNAVSFQLNHFPEHIQTIQKMPIENLSRFLAASDPILVIGRGSGYGIACEVALKLQELLGRAAMAYSSSEVLHGPAGMILSGYPVLALAVGPEKDDVLTCIDKVSAMGADCHVLTTDLRHDKLAATLLLTQVYLALELACVNNGFSPDKPRNLSKVTFT